jgi:SAM-dependent methyltransferase
VHFEIADATLTWPWKDNYFDFTHIRYLFGAVQDWPALFQEAYRCCAPGGWVQSCEADIHFYSDDGTTDSEPALQKWADLYEKGGAATGRTFFLQQEALQERSITEAGFTDVRIFDYKVRRRICLRCYLLTMFGLQLPVGGWTSNRKLFELGEYVRLTLENDLEGVYPPSHLLGRSLIRRRIHAVYVAQRAQLAEGRIPAVPRGFAKSDL